MCIKSLTKLHEYDKVIKLQLTYKNNYFIALMSVQELVLYKQEFYSIHESSSFSYDDKTEYRYYLKVD